jgi:molybdenum cofactor synthesis domain-containing protein
LEKVGVQVSFYQIIPDEKDQIQQVCNQLVGENMDLVIFTGGTGLSPRDVTTEALEEILERRIPGIEEAIRSYGQQRTPYSMFSRSVAGLVGNALILGLPGSTSGASESMDAIFPAVLHIFKVREWAMRD